MDFTEKAYKAVERRLINYLAIYHMLDRLLTEQELPGTLETKAFLAYAELKSQMEAIINIYKNLPSVLDISQIQLETYTEADLTMSYLELDDPLQKPEELEPKVLKLFAEIQKSFVSKLLADKDPAFDIDLTNTRKL